MEYIIWNTKTKTIEAVVKDLKSAKKWRETKCKNDYWKLEVIRQDYFLENVKFYN